jgi:hypothetical protein
LRPGNITSRIGNHDRTFVHDKKTAEVLSGDIEGVIAVKINRKGRGVTEIVGGERNSLAKKKVGWI